MAVSMPIPAGEKTFAKFSVRADGENCPVWACRVSAHPFNQWWKGYQRPEDQSEEAGFVSVSSDRPVRFEVTCAEAFSRATVRPLGKEIACEREGNVLRFTLPLGGYTLETDDHHGALHIFVGKPCADEGATYRFGPGVHRAGEIRLNSGESVYLADGAVVYGWIIAENAENIRVYGRGVLDGGEEVRHTYHCYEKGYTNGCVRLYHCRNARIEDVILRDSAIWVASMFDCSDILLSGVRIVGHWRYNADGVDIVNSRRVRLENCFIRSFDDGISLKGILYYKDKDVSDITVRGCVMWCDWGRTLEVGLETAAEHFRNILFEDCDLIHNSYAALDIQSGDYARISDVTFRNVRVEFQTATEGEVLQFEREENYPSPAPRGCPALISVVTHDWKIGEDAEYDDWLARENAGRHAVIDGVLFQDICVYAEAGIRPRAVCDMQKEGTSFRNVRIEGISLNGAPASAADFALEGRAEELFEEAKR